MIAPSRRPLLGLAVSALSASLLMTPIAPAHAADTSCPSVSPEVAELLAEQWSSAMKRSDAATLIGMYAPDAVLISPAYRSAQARPASVRRHVLRLAERFRVEGAIKRTLRTGCNTIVDFGEMRLVARKNGRKMAFPLRFSRVFERRGGHWTITLDHMTPAHAVAGAHTPLARTPALIARTKATNSAKAQQLGGKVDTRTTARARADLTRLVQSVGTRARPQVAGVVFRATETPSTSLVIPPKPQLATPFAQRKAPRIATPGRSARLKARADAKRRKARRRAALKKRRMDWSRSLPGFSN